MKLLSYAILLIMASHVSVATAADVPARPVVLVSVAPYKHFVEFIAGDTVTVELMVPAGTSSHTFEPTPRQMLNASRADIWFQIGEGFEDKAGRALKSYHAEMKLVDLREGVDFVLAIPEEKCHCIQHVHASSIDPHFWMSPKEVKTQVQAITRVLQERFPNNKNLYETRSLQLIQDLDTLDQDIRSVLSESKDMVVMVSHPAYGYFCRDYQCHQLSIEFEGKDPTPRELTRILIEARNRKLKKVYIQMQYNSKGARLLAQELGAEVIVLDPYSENYFESMRDIARNFAKPKS